MVGEKNLTSDARAQVLQSIRHALGSDASRSAPPMPFALAGAGTSGAPLGEMFCSELSALEGTAIIVRDKIACAAAIETYVRERGVKSIAVQSSPLAQEIGLALHGFDVAPAKGRSAAELERVGCSLIDGLALLADTGSVVTVAASYEDRLLPYLPPTCVIVSEMARLHATLSSVALECIDKAARAGNRGEGVIITGPSRTADIEKKLVLGAHGPAALAVFIIADRAFDTT